METIFDHNPTPEELGMLLSGERTTKAGYETFSIGGQDSRFADIYNLLCIRGDNSKADEYLNKISDTALRFQISYQDILTA